MARVTLEQWRMFEAVVEHGGFAQAAEAIHKSQSTINYAVNKMQDQLGVRALEVKGRKAYLTDSGELLLRRARQLLEQADGLEEMATSLGQGLEAEVTLAVDEIFPYHCLAQALEQFSEAYPNTRVQLMETILSGGPELLIEGAADILISAEVPQGFIGDQLIEVTFTAVAHPDHPLHHLNSALNLQDLSQYRQIVVRDSALKRNRDSGWLGAEQRWTVSHISTSIDMILRGLGFAWLPETRIARQLEAGSLKPLPLETGGQRRVALYLVYADKDRAGPATCLLTRLLQQLSSDG